jgi:hypothetical protein
MWMPGKVPAQMTAKIVIASAKRLIAVRQLCRSRNKIALISVPAWPIPIQKTKLTMGNAQATGIMFPHTPMPVHTAQVMLPRKKVKRQSAAPNAMYQARGGRSVSAMRATLSVIRANALSPLGAATNGFTSLIAAISQAPGSGCGRGRGSGRAGDC